MTNNMNISTTYFNFLSDSLKYSTNIILITIFMIIAAEEWFKCLINTNNIYSKNNETTIFNQKVKSIIFFIHYIFEFNYIFILKKKKN